MKRIKSLLAMLLIIALIVSMTSCFVISGRKMWLLKGTYKLTTYTYTPSHERREGYTPTTYDYVNDEKYKYEDYLIITGTSTGYYVHKDATGECYVKEITLSYEYDQEGKGKIEYIVHNDAISVSSDESGTHRLGVNKKILNYSKSAFDYTQLFTNKPMRSESITVRWEKVNHSTDLSYVEKQLGTLKSYDYNAFAARGIYELTSMFDVATGEHLESEYQYFFYIVDTATGAEKATVCYALKDSPEVQVRRDVTITRESGDWSAMTIDGVAWTLEKQWGNYYINEKDGIQRQLNLVSYDMSDEMLESLIDNRLPAEQE